MDPSVATSSWALVPLGLFPIIAELSLKGLAILAVAGLAGLALRRRSAAARHSVWAAAFVALALLPLASVVAPDWRIIPNPRKAIGPPVNVRVVRRDGAPMDQFRLLEARGPSAPQNAAQLSSKAAIRMPPWTLTRGLGCLWLVGLLVILVRYVLGTLGVRRWVRGGRELADAGWRSAIDDARSVARAGSAARVYESAAARVPLVWGWRQALVFLPPGASTWDDERRRLVLLHELAHVRRGDVAIEAVVQAVSAVFWFHPAVWFAARRLRLERERACDDAVVESGVRPSTYARHLLAVADGAHHQNPPPIVALCMASSRDLDRRVTSLLAPRATRAAPSRTFQVATVAAALAMVALVGPVLFRKPISRATVPPRASLIFDQPAGAAKPRLTFVGTEAEARAYIDSMTSRRGEAGSAVGRTP